MMDRLRNWKATGVASAIGVYLACVASLGGVLGYIAWSSAVIALLLALTVLQRLVPRPGDRRNWRQRISGKR